MSPPKYPLDALARLREGQAKVAARALADAVRAREAAEQRKLAAEAAQRRADKAAELVRERERAALERGELFVGDVARTDAWECRVRMERAALEQNTHRETEGLAAAKSSEGNAHAEVARRDADAQVVEGDREKWSADQERRVEAREEEGAAEAWRPRRA